MKKLIIVLFIGFSAMLQAQENKETKQDTIHKNKPFVGGYYVVYKDGYKSFSPADAFEDGYSKL